MLVRLTEERIPPNLDISFILYEKTVLILREFELRGSWRERSKLANHKRPLLPSPVEQHRGWLCIFKHMITGQEIFLYLNHKQQHMKRNSEHFASSLKLQWTCQPNKVVLQTRYTLTRLGRTEKQ